MKPQNLFFSLVLICLVLTFNVTSASNIARGVKVIVIDAGHGGASYPGAHYKGVSEKTLNLKVALYLGQLIEKEMPGVRVVYTRKTDVALAKSLNDDLQARADIANGAEGDLFVSIHANAATSPNAVGVETLIMGESSREQTLNERALFANHKDELLDMSNQQTAAIVRAYIQNLQFTYGEYSLVVAKCIQRSYAKMGRRDRGVKRQPLKVLYATDMPGVLTEIGFMTNTKEFAYLKSERGQREVARSIFNGIKEYSDYVQKTLHVDGGVAPKTESKPKVDSKVEVKGVQFTIQVAASTKRVSITSSQFKKYKGQVKEYGSDGVFKYKYCVGEFGSSESARKEFKSVKKVFSDAFIVRCKGGRIVK